MIRRWYLQNDFQTYMFLGEQKVCDDQLKASSLFDQLQGGCRKQIDTRLTFLQSTAASPHRDCRGGGPAAVKQKKPDDKKGVRGFMSGDEPVSHCGSQRVELQLSVERDFQRQGQSAFTASALRSERLSAGRDQESSESANLKESEGGCCKLSRGARRPRKLGGTCHFVNH